MLKGGSLPIFCYPPPPVPLSWTENQRFHMWNEIQMGSPSSYTQALTYSWLLPVLVYDPGSPPPHTPLAWPSLHPEGTYERTLIEGRSSHFRFLVLGK